MRFDLEDINIDSFFFTTHRPVFLEYHVVSSFCFVILREGDIVVSKIRRIISVKVNQFCSAIGGECWDSFFNYILGYEPAMKIVPDLVNPCSFIKFSERIYPIV
ncbi:hypothetical protein APQ99_02450 [Halobacterium salinarum DSM 3754]|uniref:Uncharacterized protein n=1 Tax=Halobacterium salinarum (strain ATCC 33171 / DSM 3754 / JCM 8978 / NBRC 102687 / NCIMB 764 / 91-R6) TaxID=2597657 RepID=A0A663A5K1_HALS9|nr:hypothetical protein APQ99_02450 [Halobacterium salinarum DSM 3754]